MFKGFDDISSIVHDSNIFGENNMQDIERRLMILEEENKQLRDAIEHLHDDVVAQLKQTLNEKGPSIWGCHQPLSIIDSVPLSHEIITIPESSTS